MRYYLTFISILFYLISCTNHPDGSLPKTNMYFKFAHVKEVVDKNNVTQKYELTSDSVTSTEKEVLIQLLKELHWEYKLSTEGDLLINQISLPSFTSLNYLDGELEKKMHNK